jgi:hypothetical protein
VPGATWPPIARDCHLTTRRPPGRPRGTCSFCPDGGARPRQSEDVAHCSLTNWLIHSVHAMPGPAAGPDPARAVQWRPLHQPTGRPRPASTITVPVSPDNGRQRTGRYHDGVLTWIPVGAAATAGPGRLHSTSELAGPVRTTRHGDEAAASAGCPTTMPIPFKALQGCVCYAAERDLL